MSLTPTDILALVVAGLLLGSFLVAASLAAFEEVRRDTESFFLLVLLFAFIAFGVWSIQRSIEIAVRYW